MLTIPLRFYFWMAGGFDFDRGQHERRGPQELAICQEIPQQVASVPQGTTGEAS